MKSISRRTALKQMAAAASVGALGAAAPLNAQCNAERPNVVFIMGDDIGFSDLGCYGAEIQTPNLDRLANRGVRFTQFYNMAKCNPTRSSLFTGLYLPRKNANNAQPFPQQLRNAGYYTAMCGKEHFDDWVPERCYADQCFDDRFIYAVGNEYFIPPSGKLAKPFRLNGKELATGEISVNKKPFYKTDVVTDYALRFLDRSKEQDKPFFLYLPYNAAHYPLQAREEDIAKYRGKYKKGWDAIRQQRFEKQKQLGVIPANATLSPPEDNINKYRGPFRRDIYKYRPWDTLPQREQDELDLEMAVFAAMVDCLDQNIGRVAQKLDEMGALENTLILFMSDNGSCPYDSNKNFSIPPGGADSYRTLSAAWANVGDTPYRFYKQYGHEGGSHTHCIAHWPATIQPGFCHEPAHLVDIYPTMLELSGAAYPTEAEGSPTPTLDGSSLLPLFKHQSRETPEIIISGFTDKFRMVRVGDWKMVKVNKGDWELYDLSTDPTELNDLAKQHPKRLQRMVKQYNDWLKS
ncbi:MAG: arylsulfatase [Candidatus Hinthialibacter antarcticus]|nr:arylsulfatase [Candidatus Hinthialibacter antarcticus]